MARHINSDGSFTVTWFPNFTIASHVLLVRLPSGILTWSMASQSSCVKCAVAPFALSSFFVVSMSMLFFFVTCL